MQPSLDHPLPSLNVAVIGAGASGLVAARELRREGHKVVVFEKGDQVGGTWVYTPRVESDPLGLDPGRPVVHSSVYESLRTNLPRETMGFSDFPFVTREGETRDPRRFPGHREVLLYLQEFASEFGIEELVRFDCEVINVEMDGNGKWMVKSKTKRLELYGDGKGEGVEFEFESKRINQEKGGDCFIIGSEIFDAVVVCSGHYTQPRIAEIPGINLWPGKQMHSHNYRTPEPFRDQVVVLIGSSTSAADLSFEIAGVAKAVHIASRSVADRTYQKKPGLDNVWVHSMIGGVHEDGRVVFQNGNAILADVIFHCTGYKYHYPFLNTSGIVTVDDNSVGPLYKHIFPPLLAPFLSFVGIPWKTPPLPTFELQSKWIAGVLSGRIPLPLHEEMMDDVNALYSMLEVSGVPKWHTHDVGIYVWDYANWLAAQCQCPGFEEWRKLMAYKTLKNVQVRPYTYRDEWQDVQVDLASHSGLKRTDFTWI